MIYFFIFVLLFIEAFFSETIKSVAYTFVRLIKLASDAIVFLPIFVKNIFHKTYQRRYKKNRKDYRYDFKQSQNDHFI